MKRVLVSAGLIRAAHGANMGKILMSRRLEGVHLAGSWEFPGGKVEFGEDPVDALKRELKEELAIEVEVGKIYAVGQHCYPEKDVVLLVYECWHSAGIPQALEVADFTWLTPREVCALSLPPADEEVIHRLKSELKNLPSRPISHFKDMHLTAKGNGSLHLSQLDDTRNFGAIFGKLLREIYLQQSRPLFPDAYLNQLPLLIAAHGDLGAGKTSLAQGIARGLGVDPRTYVNSPTFSLLQSHPVQDDDDLYFHHLDLYRLEDEDELNTLGFDEVLSDGVGYIEWPSRGTQLFNRPHWRVELHHPSEGIDGRILNLYLIGFDPAQTQALMQYTLEYITTGKHEKR